MQIQKFAVDDSIPVKIKKVPDFFNSQPFPLPATITKTRRFSLTMGGGSAGQPSADDKVVAKESGYICGGRSAGDMATDFGINGRSFDMDRVDFEVALGSVERWIITGAGAVYHPFHVHGVHFRVLSEGGGLGRRQENVGWKDTVLASGETEILIHFTKPAGYESPFMYHCHILEHEDAGMMGQFVVI
jgi:FtsP/CotA-like multicopper oxidase with cupredoxin domain